MAIVKVCVTLKDAKNYVTRSKAKRVATARIRAKRVGASLNAPKSITERIGATRSKDERVGASISRDERLDVIACAERLGDDRAGDERLGADIARTEIDGANRCRAERVMADTTKFERVEPYTARSKRAKPYTARFERADLYTTKSERVGPYITRSERAKPYGVRNERVRALDRARLERVSVNRARFEIIGADKERYERVDAYTGRYESTYTAKVGRVVAFGRAKIERVSIDRARYEKPNSYTSRVGRAGAYTTKARSERIGACRARAERIGAYRARDGVYKAMDDKGSVTLKLKRLRVDDSGNFSKRQRSVQNSEREDHNSLLYHDLVKSSNLQMSMTNDQIPQFSDRHVGIVTVTPRESFPSPVKDESIKRKEDQNTSHQGLGKRRPLSDHNHPYMTVICGSFDVSEQHVPYLELKNSSEVKKDLKVLEDSSAKSTKQNWSKEYQHKTNIVSKNFATNIDSENHHFIIGRRSQQSLDYPQLYQPSTHVEFATKSSAEFEHKNRNRVRGALKAYQEILSKFMAQKCNSRYVKAAMVLKKQGKWVNTTKQVGSIRGVKVGDKFLYRAQLKVVGLHREFDKGIDYMRRNDGKILATSIVDSGRYVNTLESPDVLIYSGQGGKSPYDKTEPKNQIMEGGNLALRNNQEEGTPIRVIRRLKRFKGSCYVYYGLYTVERVMEEREHGIMIYKFRLRRKSGQPKLLFDSC